MRELVICPFPKIGKNHVVFTKKVEICWNLDTMTQWTHTSAKCWKKVLGKIAFFLHFIAKKPFFFLRKAGCFIWTHLQPNSAVVMSPKLQNIKFRWKPPGHFFLNRIFWRFIAKKRFFWLRKAGCFFVSGGNYPIQQSLCHPNLRTQTLDENLGSLFFFWKSHFFAFYTRKTRFGGSGVKNFSFT